MKTLWLTLILLFSAKSYAESEFYGAWTVSASSGVITASTTNESGNDIGKLCTLESEKCVWFITLPIKCKENSLFPVLLNSNEGAFSQILVCVGFSKDMDKYTYGFTKFDEADEIMKKSLRVAIAFPLESDQFRVMRFNLEGSEKAVNRLDETITKVLKIKGESTKDEYL